MRYLLFVFDGYEPLGGWGDFKKAADSVEELKKYLNENKRASNKDGEFITGDNYQIVDFSNLQTIEWGAV